MPKTITEYDLLISCPGDVTGDIELIEQTVRKFNDTYSDVLSIRLNTKHWSNSSYNQSGGKAQELLNSQFIHECDAAIAVFWTRFGSPTDTYSSGTEEEIEDMISAGKQVFLYFCEKPIDPQLLLDDTARAQYQKVKDYRKKYSDEGKGIYAQYASDKEFKEKLFAHLSLHFLSAKKIEELNQQKKPVLALKGIVNGKLCDQFYVCDYVPKGSKDSSEWLKEISSLYELIAQIPIRTEIPDKLATGKLILSCTKKVELKAATIELIKEMAEFLEIELPENFFSLGCLEESIANTASILGGSQTYYGTTDEKTKYNKLIHLYHEIYDYLGWNPFFSEYSTLSCVKLAVSNYGNTFDEDIDIALSFPKKDIIRPTQLPVPSDYSCESILKKYSLFNLMGIPETQYYNDYSSSRKTNHSQANQVNPINSFGFIGRSRDYRKEYKDEIDNVFEYSFFENENDIVVKLHIDYLKHNSAVAFPTVLFVSKRLSSISYTITSKHNEQEIKGTIETGEQHEA